MGSYSQCFTVKVTKSGFKSLLGTIKTFIILFYLKLQVSGLVATFKVLVATCGDWRQGWTRWDNAALKLIFKTLSTNNPIYRQQKFSNPWGPIKRSFAIV